MSKWITGLYLIQWLYHSPLPVKPEITQFETSTASHKVCQNDVIKFSCLADANPPVISYQLFENSTANLDTNTSSLWFRNMSTGGVFIYKCVANSTLGTAHSEWIAVSVNGKWLFYSMSFFPTLEKYARLMYMTTCDNVYLLYDYELAPWQQCKVFFKIEPHYIVCRFIFSWRKDRLQELLRIMGSDKRNLPE